MEDFLGRELVPGDIIIFNTGQSNDIFYGVVYKFGKGTVYYTNGGWSTKRKNIDTVIKITEQELIDCRVYGWDRDKWTDDINDNKIRAIRMSRIIKEIDLGDYEITDEKHQTAIRESLERLK